MERDKLFDLAPHHGRLQLHRAPQAFFPLPPAQTTTHRMAKDGEDDANDREKGATGFRGQALAQVVLEMVTQAGFFPALGQHNPAKAVGLQHQLQARKPPSAQLDILDNLISPFLLLAAAEKMYDVGGELALYQEETID